MAALMLADNEFRERGHPPLGRITNPQGIGPRFLGHPVQEAP